MLTSIFYRSSNAQVRSTFLSSLCFCNVAPIQRARLHATPIGLQKSVSHLQTSVSEDSTPSQTLPSKTLRIQLKGPASKGEILSLLYPLPGIQSIEIGKKYGTKHKPYACVWFDTDHDLLVATKHLKKKPLVFRGNVLIADVHQTPLKRASLNFSLSPDVLEADFLSVMKKLKGLERVKLTRRYRYRSGEETSSECLVTLPFIREERTSQALDIVKVYATRGSEVRMYSRSKIRQTSPGSFDPEEKEDFDPFGRVANDDEDWIDHHDTPDSISEYMNRIRTPL